MNFYPTKKIVVLTSGGDAPGMNAAIRAVVRAGHYYNIEIFGCLLGYQGLVDQKIFPMGLESVANCIQHGGTILKADRCIAFYEKSTRDKCREFLAQHEIDSMIVIGGNGSFKGAALISSEGGPRVMGIPGTIDNDIPGTDYTIGFDTARNTALQAIDKIRDTASSHNRSFLVEVMGRSSGFLAVDVGIAGGAEFILIPEYPISIEDLAARLMKPKRQKMSSILVIAEADRPGRSFDIAVQLKQLTGNEYRVCILGHTQRGGTPTLEDRKMGSIMGYLAVKGLLQGETHKMVARNQDKLSLVPFPEPHTPSRVISDKSLLELNDILCI